MTSFAFFNIRVGNLGCSGFCFFSDFLREGLKLGGNLCIGDWRLWQKKELKRFILRSEPGQTISEVIPRKTNCKEEFISI